MIKLPKNILKMIRIYLKLEDLITISRISKLNVLDIKKKIFMSSIYFQKISNQYYKNYDIRSIKKELNFEIHYYNCQNEYFNDFANIFLEKFNITPYINKVDALSLKKKPLIVMNKYCYSKGFNIKKKYEYRIINNTKVCSIYRCKRVSLTYLIIKKSLTLKALVY